MKRASNVIALLAMGLLVASSFAAAQQPQQVPASSSGGQVTLDLIGRSDVGSSKFDEYRVVPEGVSLPVLNLFRTSSTLDFNLQAWSVAQGDQRYTGWVNFTGVGVSFDYNQIPHNMGNDGRVIFNETSPGTWSMSDTARKGIHDTVDATPTAGADLRVLPVPARADRRLGQLRGHLVAAAARPRRGGPGAEAALRPSRHLHARAEDGVSRGQRRRHPRRGFPDLRRPGAPERDRAGLRPARGLQVQDGRRPRVVQPQHVQQQDRDAGRRQPLPGGGRALHLELDAPSRRAGQRPDDQHARQRGHDRPRRVPAEVQAPDPGVGRRQPRLVDAERVVLPVHDQLHDPDRHRAAGQPGLVAPGAVAQREDQHDDAELLVLLEADPRPRDPRALPELRPREQDEPVGDHRRHVGLARPQLERDLGHARRALRSRDGEPLRLDHQAVRRVGQLRFQEPDVRGRVPNRRLVADLPRGDVGHRHGRHVRGRLPRQRLAGRPRLVRHVPSIRRGRDCLRLPVGRGRA